MLYTSQQIRSQIFYMLTINIVFVREIENLTLKKMETHSKVSPVKRHGWKVFKPISSRLCRYAKNFDFSSINFPLN